MFTCMLKACYFKPIFYMPKYFGIGYSYRFIQYVFTPNLGKYVKENKLDTSKGNMIHCDC